MLWVDKYAPKTTSDILGNADVARKLTEWLGRWNDVHVKKARKIPYTKENPGAKVCVWSVL